MAHITQACVAERTGELGVARGAIAVRAVVARVALNRLGVVLHCFGILRRMVASALACASMRQINHKVRYGELICTHFCLFEELVAQLALLLSFHRVLHSSASVSAINRGHAGRAARTSYAACRCSFSCRSAWFRRVSVSAVRCSIKDCATAKRQAVTACMHMVLRTLLYAATAPSRSPFF